MKIKLDNIKCYFLTCDNLKRNNIRKNLVIVI